MQGRNVRKTGVALFEAAAQYADAALRSPRYCHLNRQKHSGHLAAHKVVHRRGRAFVGNMLQIKTRHLLEKLHHQMVVGAVARRCIHVLWTRLGPADKFGKGFDVGAGMYAQHKRAGRGLGDGAKTAQHIKVHIFIEQRQSDRRSRHHHEGCRVVGFGH